jgi:hypothetical protein
MDFLRMVFVGFMVVIVVFGFWILFEGCGLSSRDLRKFFWVEETLNFVIFFGWGGGGVDWRGLWQGLKFSLEVFGEKLSLEFVGEKKSIVTFLESRLAEMFEILVVTRNLDWDLVPG